MGKLLVVFMMVVGIFSIASNSWAARCCDITYCGGKPCHQDPTDDNKCTCGGFWITGSANDGSLIINNCEVDAIVDEKGNVSFPSNSKLNVTLTGADGSTSTKTYNVTSPITR